MKNIALWQLNEYTDMKPGLERIKNFLSKTGGQYKGFPCVLIAGTNGKGSTARILSGILEGAGYRTGLYISPHLVKINERIQVNSRCISDKKFGCLAAKYLPLAKKCSLSFFEFITGVMFIYFAEKKVDIAVLEVGLGGRFDAVNIAQNVLCSIITDIDYDHCEVLGCKLYDIAKEKAGIIKNNTPVVCGAENITAIGVIRKIAKNKKAGVVLYGKDFSVEGLNVNWHKGSQSFSYSGLKDNYKLVVSLLGDYQLKNSALALACAELLRQKGYKFFSKDILRSLKNIKWPARFDVRRQKGKIVIIDGSHNPGAVKRFSETLKASPWGRKKAVFVFGFLRDKDYAASVKIIAPLALRVITVPVKSKRSLSPAALKKVWGKYLPGGKVVEAGSLSAALAMTRKDKLVVIAGSLYLAGEALSIFNKCS